MYHSIIVHVFETDDAAGYEKLSLSLSKLFTLVVMVSKVATCYKISHQVQVFIVLKRVKHVDQKGMLKLTE